MVISWLWWLNYAYVIECLIVWTFLSWMGWIISWNQDCQEKYQQPQICRWYHSNGRKQRGTKESLDEGERVEGKSWLKTQYYKNKDSGIWVHHFMANRRGKAGSSDRFPLLWALKSLQMVTAGMKLKDVCFLEGNLWRIQTVYPKAKISLCQQRSI